MIITLLTLFLIYKMSERACKETIKVLSILKATGFNTVKKLVFFNALYMFKRTFIEWAVVFILLLSLK